MLNLAESLEAMQASVLNAIWAADIERHFTSSPLSEILEKNVLCRGITRFCQRAALLSLANLFDTNKKATSLEKFLEYAREHADQFKQATEEQVVALVLDDLKWLDSNKGLIKDLRDFRDKQIAHFDMSSVRDFFDGKMAGVTNILEPTLVERALEMIEKIAEIINIYTKFYDGQAFNLEPMREQIKRECMEYAQFCYGRDKSTQETTHSERVS